MLRRRRDRVGPGWRREAKEIEGNGREMERENEGKYETERQLVSLSVWNERMHERLLQTVESGVRVLPWGSLFRAIDFHPPPTISPPNTTNDQEQTRKRARTSEMRPERD